LTILATSREALRLAGEVTWRVPSLPVPPPEQRLELAPIAASDAVRLFVERATAVQPSFTLSAENGGAIAQICRQLDGIPLAIELAAGRVSFLPPAGIAARLDQRFRLLVGGSRTALPRYQTLRASLDWSHDLLAEAERVLFRRLAVFVGGFSLEAAEAVCGGANLDVLDLLSRLVDRSLVQRDDHLGEVRYRLLETLREYAWERLDVAGETEVARRAHLGWCLAMAAQVRQVPVVGQARVVAIERVVADLANVRAALGWCVEHDIASGLRLAGDLFWLWLSRYVVEGCRWLTTLLERETEPSPERMRALGLVSYLVGRCGDIPRGAALAEESLRDNPLGSADPFATSVARWLLAIARFAGGEHSLARQLFEESLAACRDIGELWGVVDATWKLGLLDQHEGSRAQARARFAEAAASYREAGEPGLLGQLLMMQGDLARLEGNYAEARELLVESIQLAWASGNHEGVSWSQSILGNVLRAEGDYAPAEEMFARSLTYYDDFGVKPSWSPILGWRANLARLGGQLDKARERLREALVVLREVGNPLRIAEVFCFAGLLAIQEGNAERGVRLLGAALACGPIFRNAFDPAELADLDASFATARSVLGEDAFDRAHAEGQTLSFDQALALAIA
jgi:predicted ATPase/tetratricopeptide (TPR) repeat protein